MNRDDLLNVVKTAVKPWDVIVVGGGATGLGCAVEAAARGYRTLLLEQSDFAKGTSSRSTKLIHGGVRYLRQGNFALVFESLRERGLLLQNASHLVARQALIVPGYAWWEKPFYGIGLKLYDLMAGKLGLGASQFLSKEETLQHLPTLNPSGLQGGILFYDGQFDDARLAIALMRTLADLGGIPLNHIKVTALLKANGAVCGVNARDAETAANYELPARVVINATGIFSTQFGRLDDPETSTKISLSQGVHVVLDRAFLPGKSALMVPRTADGRVLFAIPWHERILIGTTDTSVETGSLEPRPLPEEVDFLLAHAARYLTPPPQAEDVLSVFAGLRPLVTHRRKHTASLSREHTLSVSKSGLLSIVGGKWTTYRKMGQDAIDAAITVGKLEKHPSNTKTLKLHGCGDEPQSAALGHGYGTDEAKLEKLLDENLRWRERLHPNLPYRGGEVVWAVRHEMARTVEDVLARRMRALFLDAKASMDMAPQVAALMAEALNRDGRWQAQQVNAYLKLAKGYILP